MKPKQKQTGRPTVAVVGYDNRLPIKVRSVRKAPLHADTQETIPSGTEALNR